MPIKRGSGKSSQPDACPTTTLSIGIAARVLLRHAEHSKSRQQFEIAEFAVLPAGIDLLHNRQALRIAEIHGGGGLRAVRPPVHLLRTYVHRHRRFQPGARRRLQGIAERTAGRYLARELLDRS